MPVLRSAPLLALLLLGGCAYDYAGTRAPVYPIGYDSGMGSGYYSQPGDRFGGQDVASIDVFYQQLSPYGRWVDSRFGRGFQPRTAAGWRPYVNGRWGEDRLWISDDPWGWATDHYGRWGHDDRIGWVWVPGTQWAPSWVAWRDTNEVAGWAPIPPGVNYSVGVGFGTGFGFNNWNSWYAPSWVWVPRANLFRPGFGGGVLPWNNGINYWNGSRWNYNYGWNGHPGYGRPAYGRPNYGRPDYARPGTVRPGNGRPPGYDDRPRNGNGDWNRNRPGYAGDDDRVRGDRPPGTRPVNTRPDDQNWQGRDPGTRPVRPPRMSGGRQAVATAPPGYAQPPRAERPAQQRAERPAQQRAEQPAQQRAESPAQQRAERAPPPARAERSAEARSSVGERYERPQ